MIIRVRGRWVVSRIRIGRVNGIGIWVLVAVDIAIDVTEVSVVVGIVVEDLLQYGITCGS